MCSTREARLARLRAAIDEVAQAAQADRGEHADLGELAARLASIWAMVAELDPGLAARLRGYCPDTSLGSRAYLATISTSIVAVTSGCSRTWTWCAPMVLIGLGSSIRRRSSSGPPDARTASAMSEGLTEPNRRPVLPDLTVRRTLSPASRAAA